MTAAGGVPADAQHAVSDGPVGADTTSLDDVLKRFGFTREELIAMDDAAPVGEERSCVTETEVSMEVVPFRQYTNLINQRDEAHYEIAKLLIQSHEARQITQALVCAVDAYLTEASLGDYRHPEVVEACLDAWRAYRERTGSGE